MPPLRAGAHVPPELLPEEPHALVPFEVVVGLFVIIPFDA
jgi:hypothetical protein